MQSILDRNYIVKTLLQIIDVQLSYTVCPKPFLKVHRIHSDNFLETNRNRSISFFSQLVFSLIAIHAEQ